MCRFHIRWRDFQAIRRLVISVGDLFVFALKEPSYPFLLYPTPPGLEEDNAENATDGEQSAYGRTYSALASYFDVIVIQKQYTNNIISIAQGSHAIPERTFWIWDNRIGQL